MSSPFCRFVRSDLNLSSKYNTILTVYDYEWTIYLFIPKKADFVVPASRQDLNQDSPWNQWIVNHLPALFVQSLHLFREKFEPIEAVKAYLRFVPLEDEIVGFFQHIPRQVAELLRQEAFLPAVGANMEIVWRKPFECVLIKGSVIKDSFICEFI